MRTAGGVKMGKSEVLIKYFSTEGQLAGTRVASVDHDLIQGRDYLAVYRAIIEDVSWDPRPYFALVRTNNWEHLYKPYAVR